MVFVPGLEEGVFPSDLDMRTNSELLEAGRLCYVAFTRPRYELILSCVPNRDPSRPRQPSPFLEAVREVIEGREALANLEMQGGFLVRTSDKYKPKEGPGDLPCGGAIIDTIDRELSANEWAAIEDFAVANPGQASLIIRMRDEQDQIVEQDTGVRFSGQRRFVGLLRAILDRPAHPLPLQVIDVLDPEL